MRSLNRLTVWALALVATPGGWSAAAQTPEERTQQALETVLAGRYDAFYAQWSPEMKKAMPRETYAAEAGRILSALGRPQSQDAPRTRHIGDAATVTIQVHWSGTALNFIASWNAAGQLQGTWFRPAEPEATAYETPPYSKPDSFSEHDISVGAEEWKLPGTLTVPKGKGPWPALVLVHGSGPNDRDESVGGVKVFRDLAEGLATRGIAVARYDKRTKVYPQKCAADPNFTMTQETVEDAVLAAAWLRKQDGIDARRIFVLGHSQGGYMMPRIMRADATLAGVVVMAGNARPLEELVVEQTEYLASLEGEPTAAQQARLAEIRHDPWVVMSGVTERYKADLKGYDPPALAAASPIPMLILQGERDYQVRMTDFDLWKAGLGHKKDVTMRSYPMLNHLFVAGEGKGGHVAGEVIGDIADWIGGGRPARPPQAASLPHVVLKPVANMYAQPAEDSEVVSQAIYGTGIEVVETRPGWLRVRTPDDYTGWMAEGDVRSGTHYAEGGRVAHVESLFAHIYREPNVTQRRPLITVPFETRLEVIGEPGQDPRWLEIRLPDDRTGWVQRGDVSFDAQPLSIEAAIELSRRFVGLPYTWGGTSSFGYDCSGFTQMLCRRRGTTIPRDADLQAAWQGVTALKREELRPGDLVFFGSAADRITHTGMYIGDGKFISATTWVRPVVQISDLSDPHWARLLVASRRLK